jgi:hypothetical protein
VAGKVEDTGHGRRVTFDFDVSLDFYQHYFVSGTILPNNSSAWLFHTPQSKTVSVLKTKMAPQGGGTQCGQLRARFSAINSDFQSCADMMIRSNIMAENSENFAEVMAGCTEEARPIVQQARASNCDLTGIIRFTIGRGYENVDLYRSMSR